MRLALRGLRITTSRPRALRIPGRADLHCVALQYGSFPQPLAVGAKAVARPRQSSTATSVTVQDSRTSQEPGHVASLRQETGHSEDAPLPESSSDRATLDVLRIAYRVIREASQPPESPQQPEKWQTLALDAERLAFESDFDSRDQGSPRLVDLPEHANDAELWACLLEYRQRRDGPDGVLSVWRAIRSRGSLHDVEGVSGQAVCGAILDAAVLDEKLLEEVWQYAERLYATHDVQWPRLYDTVVAHYVRSLRHDKALGWHLRLRPSFGPGSQAFFQLIERFILDDDPAAQGILRSLYIASPHRGLYDRIVPLLYAAGKSSLARKWRGLLIAYGELPDSSSTRPFLQFVTGYYPLQPLVSQEKLIVDEDSDQEAGHESKAGTESIFELTNRVHGMVFGIREKGFNDRLGARLFATSWLSLDLAIKAVGALGIREIGPLSLQSIVLRGPHPELVLWRIEQLQASGIDIGTSNYSTAIHQFAALDQGDDLRDVVQSDMHPDLFEMEDFKTQAFGSPSSMASWKAHRLVVAVRVAASMAAFAKAWNSLLMTALSSHRKGRVLRILDNMQADGIPATSATVAALGAHLLTNLSHRPGERGRADLDYYTELCCRVTSMGFLFPVTVLRTIVYRLGHENRLGDLQRLAFGILEQYEQSQAGRAAAMKVHRLYIAWPLRQTSDLDDTFQTLPRDLQLRHELHPIQQVFNTRVQRAIVRWGFRWALSRAQPTSLLSLAPSGGPGRFHIARGLRFLALMRERGLLVQPDAVRRKTITLLAQLYGDGGPEFWHGSATARRRNQLSLAGAKQLCDAAFGMEFLPPWAELCQAIARRQDETVAKRGSDEEFIDE